MYLIDQDLLNALEQEVVEPVRLVYIDWPGGAVYAHTGIGDISFNNKIWSGVGYFGKVGDVTSDSNIGSHSVTLGLSGIDPKTLTEVVTKNVINREVELFYGALDGKGQLINAASYFQGRVSSVAISRYGNEEVLVQAVSKTADWAKSRPERYTDESFRSINPGDYFCQYVAQMSERDLYWGSDKQSVPLVPREDQ
ncbi:hypothetical protein vBVpaS1601_28 [Vibrio phage vB_VpaS_1601]|uniref:tail protein n=1 Tax=Vibrio phage SHOU24 TaxID=1414739 RepID=UPI0003ED1C1B|nr:tail protein [Vibrio phage SHOU24]AHI61255.1 hypothetical protein SHOU24_58 [Vibrio phage SHOU24]WHM52721.1 hypothetical protein vBVpaP1601_28 [Vibrio phage vB_VpaP_1601]